MTLDYFQPTFRNVLVQEVREETKTKGGLILSSSHFTEDKNWLVIKAGKDCIEVKEGDVIRITTGIRPQTIMLDTQNYALLYEQQIVGYIRDANMANAPRSGPEVSGDSELQEK